MAQNTANSGLGFTSVLQLIFIVLKLAKVVEWSWFWVLSPTWIGLGLVLIVLIVIVIIRKVTE